MSPAPQSSPLRVALAGNPNCGKTALFNLLTGSRQKVANYAGVTVERKEGSFRTPAGRAVRVLDLPGLYSLEPQSPDEQVTADLLCGRLADEPAPEVVVGVLDSTDLRRHLRLALALRRACKFAEVYSIDRGIAIKHLPIHILEESKRQALKHLIRPNKLEDGDVKNLIKQIDNAIMNNVENKHKVKTECELFDMSRNQSYRDFLHPMLVEWLDAK